MQVVHVLARDRHWEIDSEWAVIQYLFSMVFYGPAAAGVAVLSGRQLSRTRWLTRCAPVRGVLSQLGRPFGLVLGVFVVGLVATTGRAMAMGSPPPTSSLVIWSVATTLVGLTGYFLLGVFVGFLWPSLVAVPVTAAVLFALTVVGWGVAEPLLRFGGAGGGLVGLDLDSRVVPVRMLVFGGIAVALFCYVVAATAASRVMKAVAVTALLPVVVGLMIMNVNTFRSVPVEAVCHTGPRPQVCVPARYERLLEQAAREVRRHGYAAALTAAAPNQTASRMRIDFATALWLISKSDRSAESQESLDNYLASEADSLWLQGCLPPSEGGSDMPRQYVDAFQAMGEWSSAAYGFSNPFDPENRERSRAGLAANGLPPADVHDPRTMEYFKKVLTSLPRCQ